MIRLCAALALIVGASVFGEPSPEGDAETPPAAVRSFAERVGAPLVYPGDLHSRGWILEDPKTGRFWWLVPDGDELSFVWPINPNAERELSR